MNAGQGHVALIGAGPGDPELLTIKAMRAIQRADVILHDDLAIEAVRAYARADARIIAVGKRGGCVSTPQAFIERLMLQEARSGNTVARIKGGDPYLFGRGGEELATLKAAGIACEVIPGITSGLAAPATLGIAVTHRDHTQGVAFITGHAKPGGDEPDWVALARSGLTLVVYMGVSNVERISLALIAGGLAASTPAAAIQDATRTTQREVIATLATLPEAMVTHRIGSPAILVIGTVVGTASSYASAAQSEIAAITDSLSPIGSATSISTLG
jgi:uroporphyrin-III C-methyltransferase